MSNRQWTNDQRDAISARNGTLIVSAAAGSGKTAVLIERIIERLTDPENPCDADKLLIVTFTRAATAEMRARLGAAITEALAKDPENESLRRQQMLIPSANIFTIDAFCGKIIKENFEALGIAPDYTMLDENESKVLQRQAIATVVESLYAEGSEDFHNLIELLFAGTNDSSIDDNILNLYNYSRAYASPNSWLLNAAEVYNPGRLTKNNPIYVLLANAVSEYISYLKDSISAAFDDLNSNPIFADSESADILRGDMGICLKVDELLESRSFDEILDLIDAPIFPTWKSPKGFKDYPEVLHGKDAHALIRAGFKKGGEISKLICETKKDLKEDLRLLYPLAKKFVEATIKFDEEYMALKLEKNAFDFSDITHLTLKLLVKNVDAEVIARTQLAKDISESFEEILIDEYQDTNTAQDMIFRAVSKDENNLFMVGDVKQSIYGFRQAMPYIFLEKKNTFARYDREKDEYPACVILGKNFRSRMGITQSINYIFSRIMSRDCGDIEYDKSEELVYGANYEPIDEPETELTLIHVDKGENTLEAEAKYIAKYIVERVESGEAQFGDFAILLRSIKDRAIIIEKVFNSLSIPIYTETGSGFLESTDVQVIVSLLKIIDNPLNDIPLMCIMLSEIFAFTPEDIAKLRIANRKCSLYAAVLKGEKNGDSKCERLLKALRHYRRLSVSMPAGELIREIYDDTLYPEIVSSLPNGSQRAANLNYLQIYADNFDRTDSFGISGFVRYLDKLQENDASPAGASSILGAGNYVKIMTIHKSKGLEFKYCFLADTNKKFNRTDIHRSLILHPKYGIGIKGRNLESGATYPSIVHSIIRHESEKTLMSESLRVLYVALTRAREHLIITSASDTPFEKIADKAVGALNGDKPLHPYAVRKSDTYASWILPALICHPDLQELREYSSLNASIVPADFDLKLNLIESSQSEEAIAVDQEAKLNALNKEEIASKKEEISARINYSYPYLPLAGIATKRSASHLGEDSFSADNFAASVPDFIANRGMTAAQKGTCLHKFMQYADFESAANNFDSECERIKTFGFLSSAELEAVQKEKVISFFNSKIYERIKNSSSVLREKKFAILVPAGTYNPELDPELAKEPVLIQGIADCVFEEPDGLVILDYKTDRSTDEVALIERHIDQLTTYAHALSLCLDKPVKEAYIYSFSLDREIKVI